MANAEERKSHAAYLKYGPLHNVIGRPAADLKSLGFGPSLAKALQKGKINDIKYRLVLAGEPYLGGLTEEFVKCFTTFAAEVLFVAGSPHIDKRGLIQLWGPISEIFNQRYPQYAVTGYTLNDMYNKIFYHPVWYKYFVEAGFYYKIVMRYRNGYKRAAQCAKMLEVRNDIHYHRALTAAQAPRNDGTVDNDDDDDAEEVEEALAAPVQEAPSSSSSTEEEVEEEDDVQVMETPQLWFGTPMFIPGTPYAYPTTPMFSSTVEEEEEHVEKRVRVEEDEEEIPPTQLYQTQQEEAEVMPEMVVPTPEERDDTPSPVQNTKPGKKHECGHVADVVEFRKERKCPGCRSAIPRLHLLENVEIPL